MQITQKLNALCVLHGRCFAWLARERESGLASVAAPAVNEPDHEESLPNSTQQPKEPEEKHNPAVAHGDAAPQSQHDKKQPPKLPVP